MKILPSSDETIHQTIEDTVLKDIAPGGIWAQAKKGQSTPLHLTTNPILCSGNAECELTVKVLLL